MQDLVLDLEKADPELEKVMGKIKKALK